MIASTVVAVGAFLVLSVISTNGNTKIHISPARVKAAARRALHYVHSCQVEDGGYFFARIPPGSLQDTCFAVKTLRLLKSHLVRLVDLNNFVRTSVEQSRAGDIHALYLATEIARSLGTDMELLLPSKSKLLVSPLRTPTVDSLGELYIEVTSELEHVFEAVSVMGRFGIPFDREKVIDLVFSLYNADGGFGIGGNSSLPTTYYAIQIFALLQQAIKRPKHTLLFLRKKENDIHFIEDLYYLSGASASFGTSLAKLERTISFVLDCQRRGGGFARANPIGIPTLEYTYYAISILKHLAVL